MSNSLFPCKIDSIVCKIYSNLDAITFLILITDLKLKFVKDSVPARSCRSLSFNTWLQKLISYSTVQINLF